LVFVVLEAAGSICSQIYLTLWRLRMFREDRNDEIRRVSLFFFGDCHTSISGQYFSSVTGGLFRIAAYILLEGRGQPVTRRRVGQLLWSESSSDHAGAVIRQTVARIRRFQGEHQFRFVAADAFRNFKFRPRVFADACHMGCYLDL